MWKLNSPTRISRDFNTVLVSRSSFWLNIAEVDLCMGSQRKGNDVGNMKFAPRRSCSSYANYGKSGSNAPKLLALIPLYYIKKLFNNLCLLFDCPLIKNYNISSITLLKSLSCTNRIILFFLFNLNVPLLYKEHFLVAEVFYF